VTSVRDGVPENVPLAPSRAVRMNRENISGNYVIVDLGNDAFAFYGHLKPGSIRVQRGQRVLKGQVLASLGNSGNSDAPHLHFHLADANDPLAAEGLPFTLDSFAVLGTMTRSQMDQLFDQLFEGKRATIEDAVVREMEMPMGNAIVRFE
jgi:murein DD-endopeptidase MepM/ murein hydrolase activator NlpD